jgi:hypothetical protein
MRFLRPAGGRIPLTRSTRQLPSRALAAIVGLVLEPAALDGILVRRRLVDRPALGLVLERAALDRVLVLAAHGLRVSMRTLLETRSLGTTAPLDASPGFSWT